MPIPCLSGSDCLFRGESKFVVRGHATWPQGQTQAIGGSCYMGWSLGVHGLFMVWPFTPGGGRVLLSQKMQTKVHWSCWTVLSKSVAFGLDPEASRQLCLVSSRPWSHIWLEKPESQVCFWDGLLNCKWEFIFQLNAFWFCFILLVNVWPITFSVWNSGRTQGDKKHTAQTPHTATNSSALAVPATNFLCCPLWVVMRRQWTLLSTYCSVLNDITGPNLPLTHCWG